MINGERVFFNMATMPQREVALRDTIKTILPQADEVHIYLNNFQSVPDYLLNPKITCYLSKDHLGDMGDVGKFYKVADQRGYIFTVDDKILYPADYVKQMVDTIERTHRKAAVSNHGRNFFKTRPCKSYYFDLEQSFSYQLTYPLTFVHEVGTGVLAFHSDTCTPALDWFPNTNMTDIYFSLECQKLGIPLLIHPHRKGWLHLGTRHDENYSIHAFCNKNDSFQTEVVNSFDWKILSCPVAKTSDAVVKVTPPVRSNSFIAGMECTISVPERLLAIVIPVYNQLSYTAEIIKSIIAKTQNRWLVIVVDDGSSDGTQEYFSRPHYLPLIYHRHNQNRGVNASWNDGIRIARVVGAEYIAVLNNDLELTAGWDVSLIKALADETVGIVSPYSTYGDLPEKWPRVSGDENPLGFDILGCCFAFRASLIDTIGYIPDAMVHYFGDNWLSEVAKQAGFHVKYQPGSLVHHYWQKTTAMYNTDKFVNSDRQQYEKLEKAGLLNHIKY